MSQESVELVRRAYEAFRRRDAGEVLGLLDEGVEFHQSEEVPWGGHFKGHEQVGWFFARLTQRIDSNFDPDQLVDAGDRVVSVGYTRGTVRATERTFVVPAVHVWTIRKGKVVRFEAYVDHPLMLAALEG